MMALFARWAGQKSRKVKQRDCLKRPGFSGGSYL